MGLSRFSGRFAKEQESSLTRKRTTPTKRKKRIQRDVKRIPAYEMELGWV